MKQDRISHTQLTALIWAGVLAPAAELLPALILPAAGKGSWLAPAAAIPLVLLSGWLLGHLSGEQGLADSVRSWLGSVLGNFFLFIYMVWGEVLLSLRLRLCAQRLLTSGYRHGTLWFFLLAVAALVLWVGIGKLSAFARAGQIFLAVLLTTAGVVLLLSLFQVRAERVLPLWKEDVMPVLRSAFPAAGVLGWGMYGAFLTGQVKPAENKGRWYWLFWGAGGCLLLTLSQWIVLGNLGPALAKRLENPFFALAKSVGIKGAFQRVEAVVTALWTLSDLAMAVLLLFALRTLTATIAPKIAVQRAAATHLVVATVLALVLFPGQKATDWSGTAVPWGNLLLGLVLPGLLAALHPVCKKRQKGSISCGENPP